MALRAAELLLFAIVAPFSLYNLVNFVLYGRVHVRHGFGAWAYVSSAPWEVGVYAAVYLVAALVGAFALFKALTSPAGRPSRRRPNVGAGPFFRALASSYLRPRD